jgi:tRNA-dihydrouridine synthase B
MWQQEWRRRVPVILAPMAGVSDSPFRRLARRHGADVVFSEMVSSEALIRNHRRTAELLRFEPEERPLVVQLFGWRPEAMDEAAARVSVLGVDGIDINMGCPVKKVVKTGAGAALLRDPERAVAIVEAVVGSTDLPVSVKLRAGWPRGRKVAPELAERLVAAGARAVIVHGRTRDQGYSGESDWSVIAEVKRRVAVPVIGSGDVTSAERAVEMVARTGCDGVMIGRAALGDPWLFARCRAALDGGAVPPPRPLAERLALLEEHLELLIAEFGERCALNRLKLHAPHYFRGMPGATRARVAICRCRSLEEARELLRQLRG